MIKYAFREPLTIKNAKGADPQKIGEELARITTDCGGQLTPNLVVDRARDRKNVLHPHFEWEDAVAAEAYRRDQAREIIRVIRIVDDEDQVRPAFLSIREGGGTAYRTISDVMGSSDLQRRVMEQADRDLAAWQNRYADLTDACKLVKSARAKVRKRLNALQAEARA